MLVTFVVRVRGDPIENTLVIKNTPVINRQSALYFILEYTPRGDGASFEKLELAFRNQLAQTNGVLFRRTRSRSENVCVVEESEIDSDLFVVRCLCSRGIGK